MKKQNRILAELLRKLEEIIDTPSNNDPDDDSRLLGDEEPLSAEHLQELVSALNDGFVTAGLVPIINYPSRIVEPTGDRFWETATIISEEQIAIYRELEQQLREKGYDDKQIDDTWRKLNSGGERRKIDNDREEIPFNFSLAPLHAYFFRRAEFNLNLYPDEIWMLNGKPHYGLVKMFFEKFTRQWYEVHIADQLLLLDELSEHLSQEGGSVTQDMVTEYIERAAAVGRMVESYRWRFAYGDHALRGKRTKEAASEGGKARRAELNEFTASILKEMKSLIDDGKSISDAGRLAHKKGFGTSPSANRSLWYAHRKSNRDE